MTTVHPIAAAGFSAAAALYERVRPLYPDDVVAWLARRLGIAPGATVLDLGAGTGKLTRQLVPLGARVVAVEPLDAMRAELERSVPGIDALAGTAEAIPLPDASVDAVTCAQSFHWFRADDALREMHRVLRPGGGVGLVWNTRDESDTLQAQISEIVESTPERDEELIDVPVLRSGLFGAVERLTSPHEQFVTRDELVQRVATVSFVAALDEPDRARVLARVAAVVAAAVEPIRFAYVTQAFAFDRLG